MAENMNFLHELVGSMSTGAAGNPTVAMVEAAFAHHQLHWRYINMEVTPENLGYAIRGAKAMGFRGFNCSMPHKQTVIQHLDGLGESAEIMGAVNCVVLRNNQLIGENTDGKGFLKSVKTITDPQGLHIAIFGAGGAARAIAVELGLAGAKKITIINRNEKRGTDLTSLLKLKLKVQSEWIPWQGNYQIDPSVNIVVNATSIGLYDPQARLAIDVQSFRPEMIAADVIFNPPKTTFLAEAEAAGCQTLDGLGMLVNQGIIGIKFWTGIEPDAAIMRRALEAGLGI